MAFSDKLGVRIQEGEAKIEISNFIETCTLMTLMEPPLVKGELRAYQLSSAPILVVEEHKFKLELSWSVNAQNEITDESDFGLSLIKASLGTCCVRCTVELLNVDHEKTKSLSFRNYRKFSIVQTKWGWCVTNTTGSKGFDRLKMKDIFDASKGWLHDGTVIVKAMVKVILDDKTKLAEETEQNTHLELGNDFGALFTSGADADVILSVEDGEIHAHSLVLRARSPVFAAMFSAPMRESRERKVQVEGLEKDAVQVMIKYLYTGTIDLDTVEPELIILSILQAAHRYQVQSLVNTCVQHLISRLNVATVAEWLQLADLISCTALRTACLDFVRSHIAEVQATESYVALVSQKPALLAEILALFFPPAKRQRTSGGGEVGDA